MCPNCGVPDDYLDLCSGYSGDGWNEERIYEEWLRCRKCGARTTFGELQMLYEE
jgi:hypothetical protein